MRIRAHCTHAPSQVEASSRRESCQENKVHSRSCEVAIYSVLYCMYSIWNYMSIRMYILWVVIMRVWGINVGEDPCPVVNVCDCNCSYNGITYYQCCHMTRKLLVWQVLQVRIMYSLLHIHAINHNDHCGAVMHKCLTHKYLTRDPNHAIIIMR